ncbi:MAG: TatD family hydrolase [Candidatus Omnitrophica bacterium]|nr:TatD family hydrolase [Candidatus Omnitrophota bacterium]
MLLDAHIHLQDIKTDSELTDIFNLATQQRIGKMFCNGIKPSDWQKVRQIAQQDQKVIPFFGVHPWQVDSIEDSWLAELKKYLREVPLSGVGEIGLDKTRNAGKFDKQLNVFNKQIELAVELKRPFVVHCVHAWENLFECLKPFNFKNQPFIIHCFIGSLEIASRLIQSGAYLSISLKLLSDKNQHSLSEVFQKLPLDRILLETDYPYTPRSLEPASYSTYLRQMYEKAALLKQIEPAQLEKVIWQNGTILTTF